MCVEALPEIHVATAVAFRLWAFQNIRRSVNPQDEVQVGEEIDALETLAVPSIPYLVSTRLLAGFGPAPG